MNINFQIHYRAEYGQSLCVIETQESILGWTEREPLVLNCQGTDFWQANVPISDFAGSIQYKYAIRIGDGQYIYEAGEPRTLTLKAADKRIVVRDAWQASTYEDSFYTTVFLKSLFARPFALTRHSSSGVTTRPSIRCASSYTSSPSFHSARHAKVSRPSVTRRSSPIGRFPRKTA